MRKRKTIFFICSPSLGILDNWLPVISKLCSLEVDTNIIFIFPQRRTVKEIDLTNVLFVIASKLVSGILFPSVTGRWVYADSFSAAKRNLDVGVLDIAYRVANKLRPVILRNTILAAINEVLKVIELGKVLKPTDEKNIFASADVILMDIYEKGKEYNQSLMHVLAETPKFSIPHGVTIVSPTTIEKESQYCGEFKVNLFSKLEVPHYEQSYGVPINLITVVGILRHDPVWIDKILANDGHEVRFEPGYVVVISRPGTTLFFSRERKKQALQDIWQIANEFGLKLVVKFHPKEKNESLYEEIFGEETYGEKWVYTSCHPFSIAKNAAFAISFSSGVSTDMTMMGVPTIELLNLRGIPEYDNPSSLRDSNGYPCLMYRYWGMVLGANDYRDLKKRVEQIMKNRNNVVSSLQRRHKELFADPINSNNRVATEILATIENNDGFEEKQ